MNILLTNDDGYNSEGILKLKEKLVKYGRVVIVAPLEHMSAKSASMTIGNIQVFDKGNDTFAIDGTPVDCVSFALAALDIDFDLVVSGCNNGLNLSYDTMYSGTIGAALEALSYRKPAIAVSAEVNHFDKIEFFDKVWNFIMNNNLLSNEYLLNINFPVTDVKDIKLGKLFYRNKDYYFVKSDKGYFACRNINFDYENYPDTDCYQVNHGTISIVPLNKSYFSNEIYEKLIK